MFSVPDAVWNALLERIADGRLISVIGPLEGRGDEMLRHLARISGIKLFVVLTEDRRLERALDEERFAGRSHTTSLAFPPGSAESFPKDLDPSTGPVVLHLTGSVEQDPLPGLAGLATRGDCPGWLRDALAKASLLLLHCPPRPPDAAVLLDRPGVLEQVLAEQDSLQFVDELAKRWSQREQQPRGTVAPANPAEMPQGALFLSYASEDVELVAAIKEQIEAHGLPVWFDKERLFAGDAYTQKIKRYIETCSVFLPVISNNTQARRKRYFRREWKWGADQALEFSDEDPFIIPLVMDGISEANAKVPEQFRGKQWTFLRGGRVPQEVIVRLAELYHERTKLPPNASRERPQQPYRTPVRTNLPKLLTRFIGRKREVDELRTIVAAAETQLVTLHGFAGVGKTRLAQHVAHQFVGPQDPTQRRFDGGIWFVELTAAANVDGMWQSVARALSVSAPGGGQLKQEVVSALSLRNVLLILDNCDAVEGLDEELRALLNVCPNVTCILTSRTVPVVSGEKVMEVEPLPVPPAGGVAASAALAAVLGGQYDAVSLFADRAKNVFPMFELTNQTVEHVVKIVRRLDGVPLAIELAAPRVPMGLKELSENLPRSEDGEDALLGNVIGWAFGLLNDAEKLLLMRLSLFRNGFFRSAAAAVVAGHASSTAGGDAPLRGDEFPRRLERLRQKSFLSCRHDSDQVRYLMLELIREYAAKELARTADASEIAELSRSHATYFLQRMKELSAVLHCDRLAWKLMEEDLPNSRAAMDWALTAGELTLAAEMGRALCPFFARRGYTPERVLRCDSALAAAKAVSPPNAALVAALLYHAGWCALDRRDLASAERYLNESIALREQLLSDLASQVAVREAAGLDASPDPARDVTLLRRGIAYAQHLLSVVSAIQASPSEARARSDRALELMRQWGDARGLGLVLNNRAWAAMKSSDYAAAQTLFEQALDYAARAGDFVTIAQIRHNLALVYKRRGNAERAEHLLTESLAELRDAGDPLSVASCLHNLASLAHLGGKLDEALSKAREALEIRQDFRDLEGMSLSLVQISGILVSKGLETAKPLSDAEEAGRISKELQFRGGIAYALLQEADLLMLRRQIPAAAQKYKHAFKSAEECDDRQLQVSVLISWSGCALQNDKAGAAFRLLRKARRLLWRSQPIVQIRRTFWSEAGPPQELRQLVQVLTELHQLYSRKGDQFKRFAGVSLYAALRLSEDHRGTFGYIRETYDLWAAQDPAVADECARRAERVRSAAADEDFELPKLGGKR